MKHYSSDSAGFRKAVDYSNDEKIELFTDVIFNIKNYGYNFHESFRAAGSFLSRYAEIWQYRPDELAEWERPWWPSDKFHDQVRIDILQEEISKLKNGFYINNSLEDLPF